MLSIYHCDLKGNNLVYNYYGEIKFIDFGSIVFDSNKYGKNGYTPYYNFFQFIKY
jgi:serine/threonine protein kinase